MIRLFAELFGHYLQSRRRLAVVGEVAQESYGQFERRLEGRAIGSVRFPS